ncbi:MAG: ABC transporter permease [Clostridia bacterium]|nr:MAG: ABC transporter permease [Clostridia bacterium]
MRLSHLIYRHILTSRTRALFLFLGILTGIGAYVALSSMALPLERRAGAGEVSQVVVVTPVREEYSLSYQGLTVATAGTAQTRYLKAELAQAVRRAAAGYPVVAVVPELVRPVEAKGQSFLLVGSDFTAEQKRRPYWRVEGSYPRARQVLLGRAAAEQLAVRPGDQLALAGKVFQVSGLLEATGSIDDRLLFAPLEAVQALAPRSSGLSTIQVVLETDSQPQAQAFIAALAAILPPGVTAALQGEAAARQRQEAEARFAGLARFISWLLLVIAGVIVFTTETGAVQERTAEIGLLRTIGYRQKHILFILVGEAVILALAGGLGGYLVGTVAARLAVPFILGPGTSFAVGFRLLVSALLLALGTSLAASGYPAWRAARLDPLAALRHKY